MSDFDPVDRAYPREVDADVRATHLAAIDHALDARTRLRRRVVAATVVLGGLGAPAAAVAAESALPGDALYPIKRATEAVRALVDDDITAEHRVEELAALTERDVEAEVLASAASAAIDATNARDADDLLRRRAVELADGLRADLALELIEPPTTSPGLPGSPGRPPRPGAVEDVDRLLRQWLDRMEQPGARPHDSPQPEPSPSSPRPSSSDAPPAGERSARLSTHQVEDAGTVVLRVTDEGVHVHEVRTAEGWFHQIDREGEPDVAVVGFRRVEDGRSLVFFARLGPDGNVQVEVREFHHDEGGGASGRPSGEPSDAP